MYACKFCGKKFKKFVSLGGHTVWCDKNPSHIENRYKLRKKCKNKIVFKCKCEKCGNEFEQMIKEDSIDKKNVKRFCSLSCANSRNMTQEITDKIKKKTHENNKKLNKDRTLLKLICEGCNKEFYRLYKQKFCSKSCASHNISDATRLKHRNRAIKNNFGIKNRNRHTVGYYESKFAGKVWLDSKWELIVATYLDETGINWIRPKFLYWTDGTIKRRYFPDFYLIDYDMYLDPKNKYLLIQDDIKIKSVIKENNVNLVLIKENDVKNINEFFNMLLKRVA